jgi:hypothetical protein
MKTVLGMAMWNTLSIKKLKKKKRKIERTMGED